MISERRPNEIGLDDLKAVVEDILQNKLGRNAPLCSFNARRFYKKLSIYPEKVDPSINHITLHGECGTLSLAVRDLLRLEGLASQMVGSFESEYPSHLYVVVNRAESRLVVEPSIGQILSGHNNVYVGTTKDLKNLVMSEVSETGKYQPIYFECIPENQRNLEILFREMWGNTPEESCHD